MALRTVSQVKPENVPRTKYSDHRVLCLRKMMMFVDGLRGLVTSGGPRWLPTDQLHSLPGGRFGAAVYEAQFRGVGMPFVVMGFQLIAKSQQVGVLGRAWRCC